MRKKSNVIEKMGGLFTLKSLKRGKSARSRVGGNKGEDFASSDQSSSFRSDISETE